MTASTPQLTPSFFNRSYALLEEKGLVYKVDTIDVNSSPSYAGDFPTFKFLAKVSQAPLGFGFGDPLLSSSLYVGSWYLCAF